MIIKSIDLYKEVISGIESSIWEAVLIATGLDSSINPKQSINIIKKGIDSNNYIIKRAAVAGFGFNAYKKRGKIGTSLKYITKCLNDPIPTIRLSAVIALGKMGFYLHSSRQRNSIYKELIKIMRKDEDPIVKQGATIALGFLSVLFPKKKTFESIYSSFINVKLEKPSNLFFGLTLCGITSGNIENAIAIIKNNLGRYASKDTLRTAAICLAYLIANIEDENVKIRELEFLVEKDIEFQSKLGTNSSIILSYITLKIKGSKKAIDTLIEKLDKWKELKSDYNELFNILMKKEDIKIVLDKIFQSNSLDIRLAGIAASFIIEKENMIKGAELEKLFEKNQVQAQGFTDKIFVVLRILSNYLANSDYSNPSRFKEYFTIPDSRLKKISAISYSCILAMEDKNQAKLQAMSERENDIKWGMIVGIALAERLKTEQSAVLKKFQYNLHDELLFGLLLLDIGLMDESIPLLIAALTTITPDEE